MSTPWPEIEITGGLVLTLVIILYFYLTANFDYWYKRHVPEVPWRPLPIFGHTCRVLLSIDNIVDTFDILYKSLDGKPFGGYFQGSKPYIMIRDPELIRHIFVKDFPYFMNHAFGIEESVDPLNSKALINLKGQKWRDMRARLSPAFTSGRMRIMLSLMQTCTEEMIQCVKKKICENQGCALIETKELFSCFTTDVIAACAFGIHCNCIKNPETSEFRKMGKKMFEFTWMRTITIMLLLTAPKLISFFGLRFTEDETAIFFRNLVKEIVERREKLLEKENTIDGDSKQFEDFIHHLVFLNKKGMHGKTDKILTESNFKKCNTEENIVNNTKKETTVDEGEPSWSNLSLDDLSAQVMLFFSAGFETSSSLMNMVMYEISSSEHGKQVQHNLRDEIIKIMEENNGVMTYDSLKKLTLLDRVMAETLRMYPPLGVLHRLCSRSYKIPGTNVVLDEGTPVMIPIKAMHYDEKYYPNPKKFDPDRFLPGIKERQNNFTYLPWGEGPRMCIGQRFAQMQTKLALSSLIKNFEFSICPEKTNVPLKFVKRAFFPTVEGGIWLNVVNHEQK